MCGSVISAMVKDISSLVSWVEFAPPLVIPHTKVSHSPELETIAEEEAEEYDEDSCPY